MPVGYNGVEQQCYYTMGPRTYVRALDQKPAIMRFPKPVPAWVPRHRKRKLDIGRSAESLFSSILRSSVYKWNSDAK